MKTPLGRIAADRIRALDFERPDPSVIERYLALGDPTSTVADALDELNLAGQIVGSSSLRPAIAGSVVVGPAVTLRNEPIRSQTPMVERAIKGAVRLAEIEAHNLTEPGDVVVLEGVPGCSNMGGVSSEISKRQGAAGAIVQGGFRDVDHCREISYPVWASEFTPLTGKWRVETVEINGPVQIFGAQVSPGDLVVADGTGVCFVPAHAIKQVLKIAEARFAVEQARIKAIRAGEPLAAPHVRQPDNRS